MFRDLTEFNVRFRRQNRGLPTSRRSAPKCFDPIAINRGIGCDRIGVAEWQLLGPIRRSASGFCGSC